jgi:2-polyprenyl-6-methoxyphenol hydroxylase-like FAD-dependent oxidoreductase
MGVALKRLRKELNIRILERNPLLHDQGAGIGAGLELQEFFKRFDQAETPLYITHHQRLYLDKLGGTIEHKDEEELSTSWDLLYHVLRANFDGIEGGDNVSYEHGCTVTSSKVPASTSSLVLNMSRPIEIAINHSTGQTTTANADLIIAADGPSSTIRERYLPNVKRTYAGYVAWRGTVPEQRVSQAAQDVFVQKISVHHTKHIHTKHMQILAYTIPGKNGTLEPGKRLLNWVWYVNYAQDSPEYMDVMTDNAGKKHHITLPAGYVRDDVWARQKDLAKATLPPQFAELVTATETPFIQAITDVISPLAVLDHGRVLLIGDALAGFRPHTARSTNQAAMNAMKLAEAISEICDGGGIEVLQKWETEVLEYARTLQSHGVRIGNGSQFGEHSLLS